MKKRNNLIIRFSLLLLLVIIEDVDTGLFVLVVEIDLINFTYKGIEYLRAVRLFDLNMKIRIKARNGEKGIMVFGNEYEARELYKTIKYKWRNGKPTRKYKSYMKKMRVWIPAKEKESLDSC